MIIKIIIVRPTGSYECMKIYLIIIKAGSKVYHKPELTGTGPIAMGGHHWSVRLLSSQEFCGFILVCDNCFQWQ